jgi:hypothetical protein
MSPASIRSEWPWWDDLHGFWRQLPNYNALGVQSSEPGTRHALDAEALFAPADEDEDPGSSEDDEARSPVDSGNEDHEPEEDPNLPVRVLFEIYM